MADAWLIHELLLGVLFWLAVQGLLQHGYRRTTRCQAKRQAAKKGSKAKRPFPGLTWKPHCEACAPAAATVEPTLPDLPPVMAPTAGRPRTVRTLNHYCPHRSCRYYGWLGRGNIRANGHPNGRRWRQLHCVACGHYFLETHGTLFHGKTWPAEEILRAIAALAEGLGIRAVARVFEVEPNTVLRWLVEAADHAEALSQYLLHDLDIQQVQLDELFALVSDVNAGQLSENDAIERLHRTPRWVWAAVDPMRKLLLAVSVGERMYACRTAACECHGRRPNLVVRVQRNVGGRARRRWPPASPITFGVCARCCYVVFHRGNSRCGRSRRQRSVRLAWRKRRHRLDDSLIAV